MIDYETYCRIRLLYKERELTFAQIAAELDLDPQTVAKYARLESFARRAGGRRASKLDPFKGQILRWLETHPYSATQVYQRLCQEGYTGGLTIVKDYVRTVRPVRHPAFLTLCFEPAEVAQVDWGFAGHIELGGTRRRLSFFAMVLCYSRMAYLELTCGEAMEHFLGCHQNAFEFFAGIPKSVLIDNLKTGVLSHPYGEKPTFHPRYLDFAAHYGFQAKATAVRKPQEKGRVENFVGYVKKNFLAGLQLPGSLEALNVAARQWLENIANVRIHRQTQRSPRELFKEEQPLLYPLPVLPADTSVTRTVRVTKRCRVVVDTNRYSVPSLYASRQLTLKLFADRLCLYHGPNLIATHPRAYERHRDFEDPDHLKELYDQRRRAREARWLLQFYALSPQAEHYHRQLRVRHLNPRVHINKIVALAEIYGTENVARAIEDAIECHAYSSQYIENILEQRARRLPPPGPLHVTRRADLLEIELPAVDLSPYQCDEFGPQQSAEPNSLPEPEHPASADNPSLGQPQAPEADKGVNNTDSPPQTDTPSDSQA